MNGRGKGAPPQPDSLVCPQTVRPTFVFIHLRPNGEWEQCTRDTGLALLLCNRMEPDRTVNFTNAESVIVKDGQRLLSFQAERSAVVTIDWHLEMHNLVTQRYQRTDL